MTSSGCQSILIRLDLLHSQEGNFLGSLNYAFFGLTLRCSMSVKYLGVVLDSPLTWREHVDVEVRKAHNPLWASKKAYGVT